MATRRKILVVNDEQHIVRLIEVNLVRAGFAVVKAHDAVESVRVAIRERPDLIVLDAAMPQVDGKDVVEMLRADPRTAPIPVVLTTAFDQFAEFIRRRPPGVSDYLAKPFNPRELVRLVRRRLDGPGIGPDLGPPAGVRLPPAEPFDWGKLMAAVYRVLRRLFGRGR